MATAKRSLDQFVKDKKQADCPVCKLAPSVRAQIRPARKRGVKRAEIIAWLNEECGATVTDVDFARHSGGQHV